MSALRQSRLALPLFWRTYGYIAVLLGVGLIAWVQTIHALDAKPRAAQSAAHLAALVAVARNLAVLLLTLWHDEALYESNRRAA